MTTTTEAAINFKEIDLRSCRFLHHTIICKEIYPTSFARQTQLAGSSKKKIILFSLSPIKEENTITSTDSYQETQLDSSFVGPNNFLRQSNCLPTLGKLH
jgi:hypothetical protein